MGWDRLVGSDAKGNLPALVLNNLKTQFTSADGIATGKGSPINNVTPKQIGQLYVDVNATNGANLWIAVGTTSAYWNVLIGDTGWRQISSWKADGTLSGVALPKNLTPTTGVAGDIRCRRIGSDCIWAFRGLSISGTVSINTDFAPAGFFSNSVNNYMRTPIVWADGSVTSANWGTNGLYLSIASSGTNGTRTADSSYASMTRCAVDNPWPSTLPGVAIS